MAVELRISPDRVYCYTCITVTWPDYTPGQWDYCKIKGVEPKIWDWTKKRSSILFAVGKPGTYSVKYYQNGGYITNGTCVANVNVEVENSLWAFNVPSRVAAGDTFEVNWQLAAIPERDGKKGVHVVMSCDVVTIESKESKDRVGRVSMVAPRSEGKFQVSLRATSDRSTEIGTRTFEVYMPAHHVPQIKMQTGGCAYAGLVRPGQTISVKHQIPLFCRGDALFVIKSLAAPMPMTPDRSVSCVKLTSSDGETTIRAGSDPGAYSLVFAAAYRDGAIYLPVCKCDLFVSDLLDASGSRTITLPTRSGSPALTVPHNAGFSTSSGAASSSSSSTSTSYSAPVDDDGPPGGPQCKICLSANVNTMLEPCKHVAFCEACANALPGKKCPYCRKSFTKTVRVYLL